MHQSWRPQKRDWIDAAVIGLILGTLILGVGGRIGMRYINLSQGQAAGFSWGGTLTVVFMGAVWGVFIAVLLVGIRSIRRLPRLGRGILYWAIVLILASRGLHPLTINNVTWLLPPILLFAISVQFLTCRVANRRHAMRPADTITGVTA
jgi:hypothetical protein